MQTPEWYEKRAEEMRTLGDTAVTLTAKEGYRILAERYEWMASSAEYCARQWEWLETLPR